MNRFFNPSCLVWGTNAVLKVGCNTGGLVSFGEDEVRWRVLSDNAICGSTNGWSTTITPTATNGNVIVEARFNEDAIQPRFVLPIVKPRELAVRAYIVDPDDSEEYLDGDESTGNRRRWTEDVLRERLETANSIYSQCGIAFNLQSCVHITDRPADWEVSIETVVTNNNRRKTVLSDQARSLMTFHPSNTCIAVYCVGEIIPRKYKGARTDFGIMLALNSATNTLAHELGHALGLLDCYARTIADELIENGNLPVWRGVFETDGCDWGEETGRGFYSLGDGLETVLQTLLMYGVEKGGSDIPAHWIKALPENAILEEQTLEIPVGAQCVEPKNEEVYSK